MTLQNQVRVASPRNAVENNTHCRNMPCFFAQVTSRKEQVDYLKLLLGVCLSVSEDLRSELNVSSLVHTVHVSEGRSDGEHGVGDGRQRLVDLPERR